VANQTYTISSPANPSQALYTAVANFLKTGSCSTSTGGTPPPGGWSLLETWTSSPSSNVNTYSTWQSLGADNNLGVTYYVTFSYQTPTQNSTSTVFNVHLEEVYNTSATTGGAATRAVVAFNGTAPQVPSGTSTPPWAAILTANAVAFGTSISGEAVYSYSPTGGTNNLLIAANKDGFFLGVTNSSRTSSCYVGNAPTMVTNTASPDTVPLVLVALDGSQAGATRDPGPTLTASFGQYGFLPFHSMTGGYDARGSFGVINGAAASLASGGDLYAGQQAYPTAFRCQLVKTGGSGYTSGWLRALLPTWIQMACENAVLWGDTVVESGNTLAVVGFTYVDDGGIGFDFASLINTTLA